MSGKILALVLITTLARNVLILGLRQEENTQHHVFKTKKNKVSVRRTPVNLRKWKPTVGIKKKDAMQKSGLLHVDNNDEIAQDELLVKELALSSDIGEVKKSTAWAKDKKHEITKNYPTGKTKESKTKARYAAPAVPLSERTHKRTSIAIPEPGKSPPVHPVPNSRTLLTAVGLLLNGRNHFVKDSNALSLAKVLLENGNKTNEKQTTFSSDTTNSVSLTGLPSGFGLSNILRLLNASPSQQSQTGERKSTIHTELINPTELGVSILRLLFGHKAPLVTKSTYKPLFRHNPTVSSSRTILADQRKQFNKVKAIMTSKKHRKKSFSFALAKAVSDLIKSMAREELRNYLQNIHQNPKPTKNIPSSRELSNVWPAKKVVDVQGNRKSWVLLKIPKTGDEIVPPKDLSNVPLEEEEETDTDRQSESVKDHTGIVDTLGKLNDAQPVSQEMLEGIAGPSRSAVTNETRSFPSDVKVQPTSRVGYSVRILPSLKGSPVKETGSYHVNRKPARKPQATSQSTATFAEAVKKLLQAVQSSIKSLQGKQLIGYPTELNSLARNQLPSLQGAQTTNTGSVLRGIKSDPTPVQPEKKTRFLKDNKDQEKPREELSAFTRAAGQEEPSELAHANVLFDPLKDLVMSPSEPITKSVSPTKPLGPSDNVLFESATELGMPRDRQESSEVQHIKEDLETFAEKGLQAHNHYRQEHHSSNLRWSDELATQAEKMAYDMAMRGIVQRSEVATSMGYGENVARITGVPFNDAGSVATDIWYSESRNYSYSYPRVTPQTDAFTQMIWKETKEIGMGCAKDVATNDLYVVALYRPPGNDRKFLRENVINKGTMTQDVYSTIFKRTQLLSNSSIG